MPICRVYDSSGKELNQCSTEVFHRHSKIFFGRSSKCEVCLKAVAESSISRQHFYIQEGLTGQWSIQDNESRAGLVMDTKKIKGTPLFDGTIIRFGTLFFAFGEKGVPSKYRLKWDGANGQLCSACLWEGVNSIGASHDNYVTIRLGNVARFHAHVTVRLGVVTLVPLHNILDIEIDEQKITAPVELKPGTTFLLNGFPVTLEQVETVTKRAADVILSQEDITARNKNAKATRNTNTILAYSLLIVGILMLIALGLMAMKWLPGGN